MEMQFVAVLVVASTGLTGLAGLFLAYVKFAKPVASDRSILESRRKPLIFGLSLSILAGFILILLSVMMFSLLEFLSPTIEFVLFMMFVFQLFMLLISTIRSGLLF